MESTTLPANEDWVVYILHCCDNTLYTGITNNIGKRLITHNKGTASRYTRARLPVKLLGLSISMSKEEALRLEIKIKKLPKNRKLTVLAAEKLHLRRIIMNGNNRADIKAGTHVKVVQKQDQRLGKLTCGIVQDILTKSGMHPHGIKVRLQSGIVGRVKEILNSPERT